MTGKSKNRTLPDVHPEEAQSATSEERVAAVVVTYNRKALLRQCLDALQGQTHPLAEILVIDNASTDGTRAMVRRDYPDVTLLALEENRGGAGGFHAGMKAAMERPVDWIWVMDDDVETEPGALEMLFHTGLHKHENTVGLASYNIFPDGTPQSLHAGNYNRVRMRIRSAETANRSIVPIEYSSFAGLLVRSSAVRTVGTPDPEYFIWGDDIEYSQRLNQIGHLYLVTGSKVVHHEAFATDRKRSSLLSVDWYNRPLSEYWRTYYAHRNRLLTLRRHAASSLEFLAGSVNGIWRLIRGAVAILLLDRCKSMRLRLLWTAFVHGITGRSGKCVDPSTWPFQRPK